MKIDKKPCPWLFLLRTSYACLFAVCLLTCLPRQVSSARAETRQHSRFSRAEISWAITWINSALPNFMQKGIIAKISTKDDGFAVFAGKPWYDLTCNQQGEFLKNLSRSREIIGHPPQFSVADINSAATVARVSGLGIEILTPAEGFKLYQPTADDAPTNTTTTAY